MSQYSKGRAFLVLVSLTSTVLLAEFSFRRFAPQRTLSILKTLQLSCYQSSSYLPYEYSPGCSGSFETGGIRSHVRINSNGLRGNDVVEKNKPRIFIAGDSFVFGYGVEEEHTLSHNLAAFLDVDAVNGGIWGAGPDLEYLLSEHVGLSLKPDLFIVTIFPRNDLRDIAVTTWIEEQGQLIRIMGDKFVDKEGFLRRDAVSRYYYTPVIRNSHLAKFLLDRISNVFISLRTSITPSTNASDTDVYDDEGWDDRCLFTGECGGELEQARQKASRIMTLFRTLSDRTGIPLLLVVIPDATQLNGDTPRETLFHTLARESGLDVLDLTDDFLNNNNPVADYFLPDGHWSPLGTRVSALAIARWIREHHILPSGRRSGTRSLPRHSLRSFSLLK